MYKSRAIYVHLHNNLVHVYMYVYIIIQYTKTHNIL